MRSTFRTSVIVIVLGGWLATAAPGFAGEETGVTLCANNWVYPGFPTIFRGLSGFFVGDLMGKALWKLVENAQRFPRRGGRVVCVHGPVSFHRARPCATKWLPGREWRTGPPASSDCSRPVNDKCSHPTADLYRSSARVILERQ